MANPEQISNIMSKFFSGTVLHTFLVWGGYILLALLILAFFVALYFFIQFRYKVTYPVLHYDSNGKNAQILKFKTDRARIVKRKGIKRMQLMKKRKYIEPFPDSIIRPGKRVNLMRINDDGTYTPMPSLSFNSPAQFEYLTPEEKMFAILQLEESANANQTPEATRRILMYTLIAVAFCLIAAVAAVWLIMKAPNKAVDAVNSLTPALKNIAGNIAGQAPN